VIDGRNFPSEMGVLSEHYVSQESQARWLPHLIGVAKGCSARVSTAFVPSPLEAALIKC
jgi:hypothetical protein